MREDFWRNARVAVIGGGSWGTVLTHLASKNAKEVRLWVRSDEIASSININRINPKYVSGLKLNENILALTSLEQVFENEVDAIIWALPSKVAREIAQTVGPLLKGHEIIIHATKGVEYPSLKRVSEILKEELPCLRIGVISGPNLATEMEKGQPAGAVVASTFDEVNEAAQIIFGCPEFRVYSSSDVIGVEWAGTLKNILAIASGGLEAMGFGWNTRAILMSRGLAEMVRFGLAMGAELNTFLGLAGIGDLLATCSSHLSRNFRVGYNMAQGKSLDEVLKELNSTAEGVNSAQSVWEFAKARDISMPITESVYQVLSGEKSAEIALKDLMKRPLIPEFDLH